MKLVALKEFRYADVQRFPGDEFDIESERDAHVLTVIGKAKGLERRDMEADDDDGDGKKRHKRHYKRRDMEAGD